MPTLTINGINYLDFTQAFAGNVTSPTAGQWYCCEPFGSPPLETPYTYNDILIKYTGIFDGIGRKRISPNGKIIVCDLMITDTTKANVVSAASAKMETMNQLNRFSISMPGGGSRGNCAALQIAESKCEQMGESFAILISATFIQLVKD